VEGVPPKMTGVSVLYSAYNGINITMPDAGVTLNQCALKWNRGKLAVWFVEEIFILDLDLLVGGNEKNMLGKLALQTGVRTSTILKYTQLLKEKYTVKLKIRYYY
jgi:hypothetical protein